MKITGRIVAVGAAAVSLTAGALASPASASGGPTGQAREWGMVTIEVDPSSTMSTQTIVEVGGGTWSYGTYMTSDGYKRCYSNYYHFTKKHQSSIVFAGDYVVHVVEANQTSNASKIAGHIYNCSAFWSNL
ncbi:MULTISPECIES: lactococcin 972 family bacteriocin [unclassified Streptomyces]|uniref:lactococcin 972 family bacteriocin n=1 Tax=unclassified Streptomyces TaxID=2593676 RepID=UPI003829FE9A